MHFRSLPTIEHDIVHVRPLRASDMAPWSGYLNQVVVYEHTSWQHPTIEDLSAYLGNESGTDADSRLRLAIALKATDGLVGTIGFHSVVPANKSAELAYDLSPDWWGRGIITQVGAAMVNWAHQHVGLVRVQATIMESNHRSIRAIERMGFAREGLLRSYRHVRGEPRDFFMYARLASTTRGMAAQ